MMSNPTFTDAFIKLGYIEKYCNVQYEDLVNFASFKNLEKFVCAFYGMPRITCLNEARYSLFCKNFNIKNPDDLLRINAKSFDASSLPPCKAEFAKHFLRASFISWTWQQAYNSF